MKLTMQQVFENNVVAKDALSQIVKALNEIEAEKQEKKKYPLPLWMRVLSCLFNAESNLVKHKYKIALEQMKFGLELYFKAHYENAGEYSQYFSPVIKFSTTTDNVLWSTISTKYFNVIPHVTRL